MIRGKKLPSEIPLFVLAKFSDPLILSPFPPPINNERPLGDDRIRLELVIRAR